MEHVLLKTSTHPLKKSFLCGGRHLDSGPGPLQRAQGTWLRPPDPPAPPLLGTNPIPLTLGPNPERHETESFEEDCCLEFMPKP